MNQINYSQQYQQQNLPWQQQQQMIQQFQKNFLSQPQRPQIPQQVSHQLNSPNITQQFQNQQTQHFQEQSDKQSTCFHNQQNQSFQQTQYQQNFQNFQRKEHQQQQNSNQHLNSHFLQQRPLFQHNYQMQQNLSSCPSYNAISKPYPSSSNDSTRPFSPSNNYFLHSVSNNLVFNSQNRLPTNIYNGNLSSSQYGFLQGNHFGNNSPTQQFKNVSSPNSHSLFNYQNSSISNNFPMQQTFLQPNFSRPRSALPASHNHPHLSPFNGSYSQVIQNQSQLNQAINDQSKPSQSSQFNQSPGFSPNINPPSYNSYSPIQNNQNSLINDPNNFNKNNPSIMNNNTNYHYDNKYPSHQNNFIGSTPSFNKDSSHYDLNYPSSYDSYLNYNKTN